MNVIEALGIAFWVIIFAVVIGVVAKGGWPGLTSWVAAKFGPVGASSNSAPQSLQQAAQTPGSGVYSNGNGNYTNLPPGLPT